MEEYNLLSGEPLQLFVDQESIAWGEEWRSRIDTALSQTTFFIPIITPRYFARPECRRELLEFAAKATSLGVEELVLPILYVEPSGFSTESPDEAVILVAKTQYVDWRAVRLLEPSSRDYRVAVNGLARRLIEIARRVMENQLERELNADIESDDTTGITDLVEEVTLLLPDWLDAVIGSKFTRAQISATEKLHNKQLYRLQKVSAPASAILASRIREAKELLPLAERAQKDGRIYVTRSVELDPLISSLARLVRDHPESSELVTPIREAIDEAMVSIREMDLSKGSRYSTTFVDIKHMGRIFQKCNAIFTDAERLAIEGNDIVRRWDNELRISPRQ